MDPGTQAAAQPPDTDNPRAAVDVCDEPLERGFQCFGTVGHFTRGFPARMLAGINFGPFLPWGRRPVLISPGNAMDSVRELSERAYSGGRSLNRH